MCLKKVLSLPFEISFLSKCPHLYLVQQFHLAVMLCQVKCNAGVNRLLLTQLITVFYIVVHPCRLTLSYKKQLYSLKKQTAGMSMHGRECMRLNKECLVVKRNEHLIQHYKKCLTRQHLRYRLEYSMSWFIYLVVNLFSFRLLSFLLKPLNMHCLVFSFDFVWWKNIIKILVSWLVCSRCT